MQTLFSDFVIETIESDPLAPGVFMKARKPSIFVENDMADYKLYSIIKGKRSQKITDADISGFRIRYALRRSIVASMGLVRRFLRI